MRYVGGEARRVVDCHGHRLVDVATEAQSPYGLVPRKKYEVSFLIVVRSAGKQDATMSLQQLGKIGLEMKGVIFWAVVMSSEQ